MVTVAGHLGDINDAFHTMHSGEAGRTVLTLGSTRRVVASVQRRRELPVRLAASGKPTLQQLNPLFRTFCGSPSTPIIEINSVT